MEHSTLSLSSEFVKDVYNVSHVDVSQSNGRLGINRERNKPAMLDDREVVRLDVGVSPDIRVKVAPIADRNAPITAGAKLAVTRSNAGGVVLFDGWSTIDIDDAGSAYRALETCGIVDCEAAIDWDDSSVCMSSVYASDGERHDLIQGFVAAVAMMHMCRHGEIKDLLETNDRDGIHVPLREMLRADVEGNRVILDHTINVENPTGETTAKPPANVRALMDRHSEMLFHLDMSGDRLTCREKNAPDGTLWQDAKTSGCDGEAVDAAITEIKTVYAQCGSTDDYDEVDCRFQHGDDEYALRYTEIEDVEEWVSSVWIVEGDEWRCELRNGAQQMERSGQEKSNNGEIAR